MHSDERAILDLSLSEAAQDGDLRASAPPPLGAVALAMAQKHIAAVHVSDIVRDYAVRLVDATRGPSDLCPEVARQLSHAVSPRGTIMLARGAQARAWLDGRDHVLPADIAALAPSVLAHRMGLTPRAEADGVAPEALVKRLLEVVDVV